MVGACQIGKFRQTLQWRVNCVSRLNEIKMTMSSHWAVQINPQEIKWLSKNASTPLQIGKHRSSVEYCILFVRNFVRMDYSLFVFKSGKDPFGREMSLFVYYQYQT